MWFPVFAACNRVGFDLDVNLLDEAPAPVEVPAASPFEVALFDERPSAELPAFLSLENFGPVLLADRLRLPEGDGLLEVSVQTTVFELDAPLTLTFEVRSTTGRWRLLGDETGGELGACTFTIDADTPDARQAEELVACLRASTLALGGAEDFDVAVTGTTTDDAWEYRATYNLGTDRPVEVACTGPLTLDDEVIEQSGSAEITFQDLSLAGYAAAADHPMSAVAFANTWSGEAPALAGAWGMARVGAGEGRFVGAEVEVAEDVPASIAFSATVEPVTSWPADWAAVAMDNLLARGSMEACDVRAHDTLPNQSFLALALVGAGEAVRD